MRMSCKLFTVFFCVTVLSALTSYSAHAESVYEIRLADASGLGQWDAVFDDSAGLLTLVRNASSSDPEWKYLHVRRYGFFNGKFLRAEDFDGDGGQDLALPGFASNNLLVIWSRTFDYEEIQGQRFRVGRGPTAVAGLPLDYTPRKGALVANTAAESFEIRAWDLTDQEEILRAARFPREFARRGLLGFETVAASRGSANPVLGILRRDSGDVSEVVFETFAGEPAPAYGPANSTRLSRFSIPYSFLTGGFPNGESQEGWFLLWGPGLSSVALIPSGEGNAESLSLSSPVRKVMFIPNVDDEVLVLFEHGGAEIFDFTPGSGLQSRQTLSPPSGTSFLGATTGIRSILALAGDPAEGQITQSAAYSDTGAGYQLVAVNDWPTAPTLSDLVTVRLFTDDPFSQDSPFLFGTFQAGHWATAASFAGGTVSASIETFAGTAAGLANAALQSFDPAADPGPGGAALGNQWEPASSAFFGDAVALAEGPAAVVIDPPQGEYPNTLEVTFEAAEDVTVHYRVDLGGWQSGLGPVWLTQDATVQFYGEHENGALSNIETAVYAIDQSPGADSDGDGVPDVIEALANSNPFLQDSDGDGVDDLTEIVHESDPNDPIETTSDPAIDFDSYGVRFLFDDPDGAALPHGSQPLYLADLFNISLSPVATQLPAGEAWGNATLIRGLQHAKVWLPAGFSVEAAVEEGESDEVGPAMTALIGLDPPPSPSIPLDLSSSEPLQTWRQAVLDAVDENAALTLEFTFGPGSTMAALIFEYWYGTRLLDLGLLEALDLRPPLADTPRSIPADVPSLQHLNALETPQGPELLAHELRHVIQQINSAVLTQGAFQPFRDVARDFYAQAIEAAGAGAPLDPPHQALRLLLGDQPLPAGYDPPEDLQELADLRDQLIEQINPRQVLQVTGQLSLAMEELVLTAEGFRYILFDASGRRYRLPGSGSVVNETTAEVTAFVLPGTPPPGIEAHLEIISLTVTQLPQGQ